MELAKLAAERVPDDAHLVLKDCPFCGGEAHLYRSRKAGGILTHFVKCSICGASSDFAIVPAKVGQKWNKRK